MIEFKKGNLFTSTSECLVAATNCVGVMGGGIAWQFARKFPDTCNKYNRTSRELNYTGNIELDPMLYFDDPKYILMFPTKVAPQYPSQIGMIKSGFEWLDNFIIKANRWGNNYPKSFAFPLLGAGLGGIDPEVSKDVMVSSFEEMKTFHFELKFEIWEI